MYFYYTLYILDESGNQYQVYQGELSCLYNYPHRNVHLIPNCCKLLWTTFTTENMVFWGRGIKVFLSMDFWCFRSDLTFFWLPRHVNALPFLKPYIIIYDQIYIFFRWNHARFIILSTSQFVASMFANSCITVQITKRTRKIFIAIYNWR